jgi:hypothetical protein
MTFEVDMHNLNELIAQLTPAQAKEVEDFAEFLLSRNESTVRAPAPGYLDVNSFAGMFAGLAPKKTAVELVHEANHAFVEKADQ